MIVHGESAKIRFIIPKGAFLSPTPLSIERTEISMISASIGKRDVVLPVFIDSLYEF